MQAAAASKATAKAPAAAPKRKPAPAKAAKQQKKVFSDSDDDDDADGMTSPGGSTADEGSEHEAGPSKDVYEMEAFSPAVAPKVGGKL